MKTDSKSLLIHVQGGADEFFHTNDRADIIDLIKRLYASKMKKNLPIFNPTESGLGDYCTTEAEAHKGLTRMPPRSSALPEEKVLEEYSTLETEDSNNVSAKILQF